MGEQTKFMYKRAQLKSWMVMNIVKEGWKFDGVDNGEHVPRFEQAYHATDAEIRVKFESKLAVLTYSAGLLLLAYTCVIIVITMVPYSAS